MEIGPIPGIRPMPAAQGSKGKAGQWTIPDLENRAHPDDENYTPSGNESDNGEEDGFFESKQGEKEEAPAPAPEQDAETGQVSFFA